MFGSGSSVSRPRRTVPPSFSNESALPICTARGVLRVHVALRLTVLWHAHWRCSERRDSNHIGIRPCPFVTRCSPKITDNPFSMYSAAQDPPRQTCALDFCGLSPHSTSFQTSVILAPSCLSADSCGVQDISFLRLGLRADIQRPSVIKTSRIHGSVRAP